MRNIPNYIHKEKQIPHNLSLITGDRVIVYANSFEILHSLVYLAILKAVKIDLGNLF